MSNNKKEIKEIVDKLHEMFGDNINTSFLSFLEKSHEIKLNFRSLEFNKLNDLNHIKPKLKFIEDISSYNKELSLIFYAGFLSGLIDSSEEFLVNDVYRLYNLLQNQEFKNVKKNKLLEELILKIYHESPGCKYSSLIRGLNYKNNAMEISHIDSMIKILKSFKLINDIELKYKFYYLTPLGQLYKELLINEERIE